MKGEGVEAAALPFALGEDHRKSRESRNSGRAGEKRGGLV
ncbi:hypothetical protein NOR51B_765 [Luminiphilus syltensis NOR5-1B]|uniref:Uncharacterized protein n=1 Tax=Luminiphilus syltensis NOR5-1B TaxID=565045 RepID=B8KQB2_9GAMM|nr:hypothetical protein NOR51B_765 [Luminiphilus syltensis NOR5-1B]